MINLKRIFNTKIDSKILNKAHNYAVLKFNSDSELIEKAIKDYLRNHPLDLRKDLHFTEIVNRGPLGSFLKPREKRRLTKILKDEHIFSHKKGDYLPPSDIENNLYYVLSGTYFERRELNLSSGSISFNQDLIAEDEIFGEEFSDDAFSNYWEPCNEGKILKISSEARNELTRKIPKIKENLDYLISQKFRKMDYISTIRSSYLNSEEKVKYGFNFLVQRLGHTLNGESSRSKVSMEFNGKLLDMGSYSDYGVLKRIMHDDIGDLVSVSRESVSRVLNNHCFNLNENNFRISFLEDGYTYIFRDLLNEDGKIIKLNRFYV